MARTKKSARVTAPLERYIRKALGPKFNGDIFSPSPYLTAPTLIEGQVSRILTYRGCFNPPHHGHKDALCHAFFRSGADANITAAIVYFVTIDGMANKYFDGDSVPLLLTQEERMTLLNKSGLHGGWHWCYPRSILEQVKFQAKLKEEAAKDGFEIDFVTLLGPDHASSLEDGQHFHSDAIVAGTGYPDRTNFRAKNKTGLQPVGGYSKWKNLAVDQKLVDTLTAGGSDEWLKQKMDMLSPEILYHLPPSGEVDASAVFNFNAVLRSLGPVRESFAEAGQWLLRYVPTQAFGTEDEEQQPADIDTQVSSTKIRQIIEEFGDTPAIIHKLAGSALIPDTLFKFIRRHQKLMAQARELHPDSLDLQMSVYKAATKEPKPENLADRRVPRELEASYIPSEEIELLDEESIPSSTHHGNDGFDDAVKDDLKYWDDIIKGKRKEREELHEKLKESEYRLHLMRQEQGHAMNLDREEQEEPERPHKRLKLSAAPRHHPHNEAEIAQPTRRGFGGLVNKSRTKYSAKKSTGGRVPRKKLASKAADR